MTPRTHRHLVGVEVIWPAQTLPISLQQAVDALTQGETPDQIIARMNLQGFSGMARSYITAGGTGYFSGTTG